MGNIKDDFGVSFSQASSPGSTLNFTSKGTRSLRLVGDAKVKAFPDDNVEAKLSIEFASASSFLLKAKLTVLAMQNVNAVAKKLAGTPTWRRRYIVVSAVYSGKDCAIISSKSANSKIELSGKASALKQFDLGAVAANLEASNKQDIGLDIVGESGAVGLAFFKLPWGWGDDPKGLAARVNNPKALAARVNVKVQKSSDKNWPKVLPDEI